MINVQTATAIARRYAKKHGYDDVVLTESNYECLALPGPLYKFEPTQRDTKRIDYVGLPLVIVVSQVDGELATLRTLE